MVQTRYTGMCKAVAMARGQLRGAVSEHGARPIQQWYARPGHTINFMQARHKRVKCKVIWGQHLPKFMIAAGARVVRSPLQVQQHQPFTCTHVPWPARRAGPHCASHIPRVACVRLLSRFPASFPTCVLSSSSRGASLILCCESFGSYAYNGMWSRS